jgi:hypothetical protein
LSAGQFLTAAQSRRLFCRAAQFSQWYQGVAHKESLRGKEPPRVSRVITVGRGFTTENVPMANEQNDQSNPQQGGQNKPGQQQQGGQNKPGQQQQSGQNKPGQQGGQGGQHGGQQGSR